MRLLISILSFVVLFTNYSCKSNNGAKSPSAEKTVSADQKNKFQPSRGFDPVGYGISLDPNKEQKLRILLGTDDYKKVNAVDMTKELNDSWNMQAKNLIESRNKEAGSRINAALVSQYWLVDGIYKDTMANPQIYEGQWVKFEDNGTYTYGTFDVKRGSGIYNYQLDKDLLLMVDNDPTAKALEFEVQFQAGFIVFYGTKSYDDNDIQMKMAGRPAIPAKP